MREQLSDNKRETNLASSFVLVFDTIKAIEALRCNRCRKNYIGRVAPRERGGVGKPGQMRQTGAEWPGRGCHRMVMIKDYRGYLNSSRQRQDKQLLFGR